MIKLTFAALIALSLSISFGAIQEPKPIESSFKMPYPERSQYLLFMGKVKEASLDQFSEFFKNEVMPALSSSSAILRLDTYTTLIGGDLKFVAFLELRPDVPISADTAFRIFLNRRTPQQAHALMDRFASYFDATSTSLILHRPDLSIARTTMGFPGPQIKY